MTASRTMKAIRVHAYGGVEQLIYEDGPVPTPAAGQVLVKVVAASVNPFDHKLASGAFAKFIPLKLPYIPGADFSGIVDSVGVGVSGVQTGDAVYGNSQPYGSYAQFVAAPATTLAAKPKTLGHVEASSVPTVSQTAWQAIFDIGHLQPGQTILIHAAAGGVGTFAVQLAHWKGARVLATASGKNIDYVRSLGADQVIDYKTTRFETVARDVDVVLDLLGGETQTRSFDVLRKDGCLVSTTQPPSAELANAKNVRAQMVQMQSSSANLSQIANLIDSGKLKTTVAKKLPLKDAAEAWKQILSGHTQGKIVLEVPD